MLNFEKKKEFWDKDIQLLDYYSTLLIKTSITSNQLQIPNDFLACVTSTATESKEVDYDCFLSLKLKEDKLSECLNNFKWTQKGIDFINSKFGSFPQSKKKINFK